MEEKNPVAQVAFERECLAMEERQAGGEGKATSHTKTEAHEFEGSSSSAQHKSSLSPLVTRAMDTCRIL